MNDVDNNKQNDGMKNANAILFGSLFMIYYFCCVMLLL